ncbi:MAG: DUF4388 domain-containing protein [Gemmatimonadaceae bacterium]
MAIEGPLRELGIHDVFQLLDLSRKTGRLRVTSALRDNEGSVDFAEGRVVAATIRTPQQSLGDALLAAGRVTAEALARARAAEQGDGKSGTFGDHLVEAGAITRRELQRIARRQIEDAVFELMSWQEGFFSFIESDEGAPRSGTALGVPTEALLMEAARRIDEWAYIQQRIPHVGVVGVLAGTQDGHASSLDLRPNEWEVLAAMDGAADLRTVATQLGRSDFEVAKIAYGLVATGIIHVREPDRPAAYEEHPAELAAILNDAREALHDTQGHAALSLASTAVSLAPADAEARLLFARALFQLQRDGEGEAELRHALAIDSRNQAVLMETARLAARRGDMSRAIDHWQRVVQAAPSSPLGERAREAIAVASRLDALLETADV